MQRTWVIALRRFLLVALPWVFSSTSCALSKRATGDAVASASGDAAAPALGDPPSAGWLPPGPTPVAMTAQQQPEGADASAESDGPSDPSAADGDAEPPSDDTGVPDAAGAKAAPPFDPGEGGICDGPMEAGDLVVDEMMIESVVGTGDHGEWLEVQSTRTCAINLRGLQGNAPSGNRVRTFDIGVDVWIPALGRFIVADSSNRAINHDLPGTLIVWSGQPGDVLRNKGGTVTLQSHATIVDSVTYPALPLLPGVSLAFPSDCAPDRRSDWSAWQTSTASWFPGFMGTPSSPNVDVQCP